MGSGIVALPSGVAAFGDAPSALVPAIVLIWMVGLLNTYYFSLLGRICAISGGLSYRNAWEKTVGNRGAEAVATVCMLKAGMAVWCLSVILADSSHSLLLTAGINILTRAEALVIATILFLLPLCLVKNLNFLAPFSMVGVSAVFLTTTAMWIRYFDKTYKLPDGVYLNELNDVLQPNFGDIGWRGVFSIRALVLICMLSTAFVSHYNAPRFYVELKNPTLQRYNTVVGWSFVCCAALFSVFASAGFLTFGASCSGYILKNYAVNDILAAICRVAMSMSVIFTYPVLFVGFRDGLIDMIGLAHEDQTAGALNLISVVALAAVTTLAALWRDLTLIVSIGGATLSTVIIFVFPAIMFRSAVLSMGNQATKSLKLEVRVSFWIMGLGILMGVLGTWIAVNPTESDTFGDVGELTSNMSGLLSTNQTDVMRSTN